MKQLTEDDSLFINNRNTKLEYLGLSILWFYIYRLINFGIFPVGHDICGHDVLKYIIVFQNNKNKQVTHDTVDHFLLVVSQTCKKCIMSCREYYTNCFSVIIVLSPPPCLFFLVFWKRWLNVMIRVYFIPVMRTKCRIIWGS